MERTSAYAALREFLKELDAHSRASKGRLRVMIADAQRVGIGALLVTTVYNTEFKLGDSFDFDATFSGKEKVKIEVTLPSDWDTGSFGRLLAVGASNVISQTVSRADVMQTQLLSTNQLLKQTGPLMIEDDGSDSRIIQELSRDAEAIAAVRRAAIREWARENGHQVSDRGRISKSVMDTYQAAN